MVCRSGKISSGAENTGDLRGWGHKLNLGAKNFGAVEFLIIFKRAHSRAQKIIFLELGGNAMDEDRDSESVMEVHKIDEFMEDSMSGDGKDGNDGEVACFEQKKGEDDDDDDSDDGSDSDSDGSGEGANAAVVGGKVLRRPSGEIGGELKESDESEKERNGVSEEERHDLTWSNPVAVGNVGLLSFSSDNDEFRRLARSEEMGEIAQLCANSHTKAHMCAPCCTHI